MNRVLLVIAVAVAMVGLFAASAVAEQVNYTVPNFSFESNVVADGVSTTKHGSWTDSYGTASASQTYNPTTAQFDSVPNGSQVLKAMSTDGFELTNMCSNAVTLEADRTYYFTIAIGKSKEFTSGWVAGNMGIFDLNYGGGLVVVDRDYSSLGVGEWGDFTISIASNDYINGDTINEGDVIGIMFWLEASNGDGAADNARFYSTPEPSTLVLLAAGLIGMVAYAWRKRK
jgi:hypothetical protein